MPALDLPLFRFAGFPSIRHAVSTRHGGVSPAPYASLNMGYATGDSEHNVATNRARLLSAVGARAERTVSGWLTHGTAVAVFQRGRQGDWPILRERMRPDGDREEDMFPADAVISDVPDLTFFLTFADCVPLLFHDPVRNVIGAAHAGWRGTAGGMAREVLGRMAEVFGSRQEDVVVGIGPSVGPCCYTVSPDVPETFTASGLTPVMHESPRGQVLDLWESNRTQLLAAGVRPEAIELAGICTSCRTDMFFSHRAERGVTGRFALCAGL